MRLKELTNMVARNMKYCINTTRNHPITTKYPQVLEDINDLLINESRDCVGYLVPTFNNNESVINMDSLEAIVARDNNRARNKSMDLAFGINSADSINKEMVLVEIRLNYINPNNLNKEELEGKVNGSSQLLSGHHPIHNKYIFIFKSNQIQEAISRLRRMIPSINSGFIVMDVEQLQLSYFNP